MKRTTCLSPCPIIFKKKCQFLWVLVFRHFLPILPPIKTSNKPKTNPKKKVLVPTKTAKHIPQKLDKWKNRSLLCNFCTAYECQKLRIDSQHCSNIPRLNQGIFWSFLPFIPFPYTVKLDFKEPLIKEQIDFKELFTDYQLFYTINLLLNKELLLI